MEHLQLKATATTTDRGEFSAIAAAYSVDRVKDRIIKGAFEGSIRRWQASGKRIPLHWDHRGEPDQIIGSIDPASMQETDEGLVVKGRMDLEASEVAREAWRAMKTGSMSLSFGYVATKTRKASGGVQELLELDLFEISIVPAPANADTRVLEMKNAEEKTHIVDTTPDGERDTVDVRGVPVARLADLEALRLQLYELEGAVKALQEVPVDSEPETASDGDDAGSQTVPEETRSDGTRQQQSHQPRALSEEELALRREVREDLLQALTG